MDLVKKLVESPWFWLDFILSISGGIFVWRGLLIEKKAEKLLPPESFNSDIFGDIVEQYKSEIERGWRILMRGIIIEVVAALGISVISGLEIADLTDKAAASEQKAGEAIERAAIVESNNLVLAKEVFGLTAETAQISTNITEIRALVSTPEITDKLNEAKNSLAEAGKTIADAKSILANPNFKTLTNVKPLKEQIIDCLNAIDNRIVPKLALSTVSFKVHGDVDSETFSTLKKLSKEPGAWQYLQIEDSPHGFAWMSNGTQLIIGITIWLYPALLKKE